MDRKPRLAEKDFQFQDVQLIMNKRKRKKSIYRNNPYELGFKAKKKMKRTEQSAKGHTSLPSSLLLYLREYYTGNLQDIGNGVCSSMGPAGHFFLPTHGPHINR